MPRYAILEHDHPERHWDFLLEAGDVLRAWRLAAPPWPGQTVAAEASFDHRRLYLDYEGPVSGDRGRVVRWDAGLFSWEAVGDGRVVVRLEGGRCRGTASLTRGADGRWSLTVAESGG
jgi:hypothetical protein